MYEKPKRKRDEGSRSSWLLPGVFSVLILTGIIGAGIYLLLGETVELTQVSNTNYLRQAQQRWQESEPDAYRYDILMNDTKGVHHLRLTVEDGMLTDAQRIRDDGSTEPLPADDMGLAYSYTMDVLWSLAQTYMGGIVGATAANPGEPVYGGLYPTTVHVHLHPTYHYLTHFIISECPPDDHGYDLVFADGEYTCRFGFKISNFTPLEN